MPRIKVNEQDVSWYYRQRAISGLTVFMPLFATWGPTDRPMLTDVDNFEKVFGTKPAFGEDLSYVMAQSFIKSGFNVLGWRFPVTKVEVDPGDATKIIVSPVSPAVGAPNKLSAGTIGFVAKYPGSFGNNLELEIIKLNTYLLSVKVYSNGSLIDTVYYDFNDPKSENYFINTSRLAPYITLATIKYEDEQLIYDEDITGLANKTCAQVLGENPTLKFSLAGGADGDNPYKDANSYALFLKSLGFNLETKEIAEKSILDNWFDELTDPLAYDFDIICSSGLGVTPIALGEEGNEPATDYMDKFLVSIAKMRKDIVHLVDGAARFNSEVMYSYCGNAEFDSSYASGYGPWSYSYVVADGSLRKMPGSYVFLVRWGQALAAGSPAYLAPAGVKRADVGNIVQETMYPVGSAVLELWQNHEDTPSSYNYKVNPIARLKQYGYVIYGNSTLLHDLNGKTSMLQSFSTRVVANFIKKRAFDISLTLQFDQMDDGILAEFKTLMTTYLDTLKYGGALYSYKVVVDRSDLTLDNLNTRTIPVKILISPNPAAENFIINLEIHQAGVTFGDDTTDNEQA